MKFFTLFLSCFFVFASLSLSAKAVIPIVSVPEDTLSLAENQEMVQENLPSNTRPDSMKIKPEQVSSASYVASCDACGQGLAFIDLTPDPNTQGPWLFMWTTGETTEDIMNLTAGTYIVSIFDSNNQLQIKQCIVPACSPISPISITGVVTGNTLCNGTSNGAIDLTVNPTPNLWNYFWSSGETTEDISNVDPGVYTVSVTWGVTCTTTETFIVPNLTNAPTLSPPIGGFGIDYCETSSGTAAVFIQGGTQPYSLDWSNGGTDLQITGLTAGQYTVTVTGADGCTSTLDGEVPAGMLDVSVALNALVYNTTCNGANGSISITVNPPGIWLPSATFLWSNGATTQNISNLSSGTYRVTVTRLGVCTATDAWYIEDEPILPSLSFAVTTATCGKSNGGVNLTTLPGGIAPYTYNWSNGATTEDLTNVPAGTYDVTLTSANGCTSTGNAVVEDNQTIFGYNGVVTDQTACDTINGRISLSLFPANLAYTWSNGATTTNLAPLAPGSYTVTISAGGTCTAVETYSVGDVRDYPQLPVLIDTSHCGLANGGIDLLVTGGVTPLTYTWSNGASTQDLINIKADTFYVTVTSAVGCSNQRVVIVPNVNDTIRTQANVLDNFSCTSPTGVIDLQVTPLDTLYTFLWSGGQTTDSLYNLTGGNYQVTVTLGLSCMALDTFDVVNNALPPNLSATSAAANCGLNNGSADLSISNGVGPFSYLWSNSATTEDLATLPPGTYAVTVTGANSCSAVLSTLVPNNNIALNVNGAAVSNTSCAVGNGSVDINVAPVGAYNYVWSNTATTEDLGNLAPGNYTVTVSLGTCISSNTFAVIDNAVSPNLSAAGTAANCGLNDGSADLSVSGGNGPFSFLWSNSATTEDLSGLLPGNYSVTVTGANSCTSVSTANVQNNNIPLNLSAALVGNSSCIQSNGFIDVSVAPAGTYTYLWSNALTTEDLNGLNSGNYTVTVTLGTCESSSTFSVADNTATPAIAQNITASICGANNGAIDLSISGPAAPYTYLWSNMATTEDLSNLLPGNYSVTVTAANGCTDLANLNVPNNASNFSLAGAPAPLTNCAANNGAVDLNITPAGAYTYLWSNMATTEDLNGLTPGTYTVSVTSGGSCTATASFFVVDQRTNPLASQMLLPEICGLANGSIDLSVSGGATPYSYLWNSGQQVQDLNNLAGGTYSVTVTDANNCTVTVSAFVPSNTISFALAGTFMDNNSCLQNNGSIDLSVNPVPPGASYLWSDGQTTQDLSGLNGGSFTVTVSAGGTCTNTASFVVANNVPSPLLAQNITAAACGQSSGSIDLSISGSPAPYQYKWSNMVTNEDLNAVISGTYSVTVTAANGCTSTSSYTIPENVFVPNIASTLAPASSCTTNNGAIDLTVTPAGTYTYSWSNAAVTEDLNNISAGIYTVTVSAGGACTNTAILVVSSNVPAPMLSNNITGTNCGQADGSIDLSVSGSPTPYTYLWSNANTNEDINALSSGNYTVTVTAGNGCTTTQSFTVPDNSFAPSIGSSLTPSTSCTVNNGAIDLTVTPAQAYTFVWSNGSQSEDLMNVAAGTYTVTVSAGGNCSSTASITVTSNVPQPVLSNMLAAATCGQASGSIDLSVTGSPAPYGYLWSNNSTNQDLNSIVSGNYTVTVTAANGCTSTGTFTVPENVILPVIAGTPTATNSCLAFNGAINITVTPGTGYVYSWSNGIQTEDLTNLAAGSYTVTVNGGGACISTSSFTIADQTTQPVANITAQTTNLDCTTLSSMLTGSITGTNNATSTQWLNNGNLLGNGSTLPVTAPGIYQFVVVDNVTACTATASITISQSLNPPQLSIATPALLTCIVNSQTLTGSSAISGVQFAWATISGTDTTVIGAGPNLMVSAPGTYFLLGSNPANHCSNAVPVTVLADLAPPTAEAGQTFTLDCAGETAPLNGSGAGAPNLGFQWTSQDGHFVSGASTAAPLIDKAGTYSLVVTNPVNGCTATDQVIILPEVPVAFTSAAQPNCLTLKGAIQVDSVSGLSAPILYSLNGGTPATQNQFTNLTPGIYTVAVQGGNGCSATTSVTLNPPALVEVMVSTDTTITLGHSYLLESSVNIPNADIESIQWTPSTGLACDTCLNTLAIPQGTTDYQILVVSKVGCEARGNVLVTVDERRHIYAPNIFSPDGNGTNDVFTIFADPVNVVIIKSLQVYSRWGEAIYEAKDLAPGDTVNGWDGNFHGQKLNPAVFVWRAVILFADGKEEQFTGDVTLDR